jgi:hypothetical protein
MEFVPSNIIKTPDFGAMAQNAMQQKRQDINEMNNWMDSNQKKEGAYLEGDKPAVQEAWNKYQEELDRAVESGNRDARRKADEAYGSYVQIAGTALSLSEQYRSQVAAYKTDPSKFSISGQEFLSLTDQYRRTRRSANDIAEAAQNPFVIAQSMKYDLSNPLDQAGKMVEMSAAKVKDFYDAQGNLDTEALKNYAEELATATINANETSLEKAMAWGGVRSGYAGGEDGMINSMEELEFLRNQPEEKRQEFIDGYKNELVNNYINLLSNKKKEDSGKKKLATNPISLQAAGGETVNFITLPGDINGITQIGAAPNGEIFITVEERVKTGKIDDQGNEIYETKVENRPATQTEVSKIMSKYGNTYDFSSLNVQPQQQTVQADAEQPAADKPKDTLGLGIFDTPEPAVETEVATGSTEVAPAFTYDQWSEDNKEQIDIVSTKIDDVNAQLDNPETSSDVPNMFDEASRAYEDIKNTRKEIDKAKNEGQDTAELEKILEVQVNTVKRINETNKRWSEKTKETSKENETVEQEAVEAEEKQEREYIVIDGKPYFKDDYKKIAGKRTGKGNYPDTFEEYAKSMGVTIANTKDKPLSNELDEVTVTAERISPPVSEVDVSPVQAGGVAPVKRSEEEAPVIDIIGASPSLSGSGKPDSKHIYKSRSGAIAPAEQWTEESGVPAPSKNPSSTSAPSYYLKGKVEGMEWTPETVKKAMDRWNNDVPVDPEVFIKAANTFGIPVEFIIALAAKEGGIGVGDRQVRTKNFFNWGNSTKGDNLPPGPEQDKYNKYFETWEDGVMAWADGLVRMYRPDDGDWSKLWADDKAFVTQRSGAGFEKGSRYAESTDQEAKIKEIIDYSYALQFDPKTSKNTAK